MWRADAQECRCASGTAWSERFGGFFGADTIRAFCPMRSGLCVHQHGPSECRLRSNAPAKRRGRLRIFSPTRQAWIHDQRSLASACCFVRTSYNGFFFVTLKPWGDREQERNSSRKFKQRLNQQLSKLSLVVLDERRAGQGRRL